MDDQDVLKWSEMQITFLSNGLLWIQLRLRMFAFDSTKYEEYNSMD